MRGLIPLWILACAPAPDLPDAGIIIDAAIADSLEIGTGGTAYEPLEDEGDVPITAGAQGGGRYNGYHVFVALLAAGVDPEDLDVLWRVHTADGELELGDAAYRVDLLPLEDRWGAFAMRVILQDCCAAENQRIAIALEVTDRRGKIASALRVVRALECPGGLPDPTIDPCQ